MTNYISIPEARRRLREFAVEYKLPELAELADKMRRRKPRYKGAPSTRKGLSPELAKAVRDYKKENPKTTNRRIGEIFGIDGGRVSEAIHHQK